MKQNKTTTPGPPRIALVTGASGDLGGAISMRLAREQMKVWLHCYRHRERAERVEAAIRENGGEASVCRADLTDAIQTENLIRQITAESGPIDVLVNNAGMETTKSIFDTTRTDVDELLTLNLNVPIHLSRAALARMRERGRGHIVNISSMAANGGFGGMSVYSASKAGLSHFTRIVRQDLKGLDVRVTNLEVGPVPTDLLANLTHPPAVKSFARFRRMGLMPNVAPERVGAEAVRAVQRSKRAVWLPKRAFLFGFLAGAPQRIAEPLIRNIR